MSKFDIAIKAWNENPPDWVVALAKACDQSSQNKVATLTGLSAATISNVCANKYGASLDNVEEAVRGVLMRETVDCPGLGEIPKQQCRTWRIRAAEGLDPINPLHVSMHHACRRCSIYKESKA